MTAVQPDELAAVAARLGEVVTHITTVLPAGPARVEALNRARNLLAGMLGWDGYELWDRVVSEQVVCLCERCPSCGGGRPRTGVA